MKLARNFCAKVLSRIISLELFFIWHVLKPPLWKIILKRIWRQRFFFNSTKWLKAYETGYPIFINKFLKQENVVYSKCQHCSYIKITSLKLAKNDPFFFHENHRIPDCKKNKMFLIESITRQNIDLAFIHFSFMFTFSRVNSLQDWLKRQ